MLVAVGVNVAAVRGAWHRKYLDYRTLAEGLRVEGEALVEVPIEI